MKFKLGKASYFNTEEEKKKYEKLGFKFTRYTDKIFHSIPDWVTNSAVEPSIEISTLEELLAFIKEYGEVVINEDSITIYDGYQE